jgi:hypothetical protein
MYLYVYVCEASCMYVYTLPEHSYQFFQELICVYILHVSMYLKKIIFLDFTKVTVLQSYHYCPFALNKNPEVETYLLWQYCS